MMNNKQFEAIGSVFTALRMEWKSKDSGFSEKSFFWSVALWESVHCAHAACEEHFGFNEVRSIKYATFGMSSLPAPTPCIF